MAALRNATSAMALRQQQQPFNPWELPPSFTVYEFAPEDVRQFLHPHWQTQQAVHPAYAYFFGLYYLVMGIAATVGNVMVLKIFSRFPALRTPSNVLIMNLAVSDLLLMIALIPESVFNFFSGGPWKFGNLGCQIHAFCGAFFGYSQITTLVLISWDRYRVIVGGILRQPLSYAKVSGLVMASWIWSFGWSVSPLVGWGGYELDGMLGTCSFDAYTKTFNNKTHILAACLAQYGLPILVIVLCYVFIVRAVFQHEDELRQQARKMNVASLRSNTEQLETSAEIRAAKVAMLNVTLWILAWTPFTVVCMVGTWGNTSLITPLVSELPVLMAKTSAVYNPIIYSLSHPKYRECLKEMYPWMCIVLGGGSSTKDKTKKAMEMATMAFGDNQSIPASTNTAVAISSPKVMIRA